MIGKHLKEYKKNYIKARKAEPRKARIKKNSDWKKRWLPFIKYDHDFDGAFFLELIVHKLHILLDYYDFGKYVWQIDESRLEIVDSLKEACRLGDLLLADEFENEAYKVMEAHMHISSKLVEGKEGTYQMQITWDSPEDEKLYEKLRAKGEEKRAQTEKEFFEYIGKNYHMWWD